MQPEIDVLGISIKTFGLMFALAFLASGAVVARRMRELGRPVDWAYEMGFAALVGGLVGARVYYFVEEYDSAKHDILGSIFSGGGLVWYGGLIGGALAVVAWAAWRGILNLGLLDLAAPALAVGYAVGRVGCQVSGDGDYGDPSEVPWAMAYPDGAIPTDERVHPTPIYETLAMGIAGWVLWRWRDALRPGALFAVYLVLAGAERFLVEFVRRNDEVLLGLTAPQLQSLALCLAGAAGLLLVRRRHGGLRAAPAEAGTARPLRSISPRV